MNAKQVKSFVGLFQGLMQRQNALDCEWAAAASRLIAAVGGVHDDAMKILVGGAGMTVASARARLDLATIWSAIPNAKTWNTLGISGVQMLASVEKEDDRAKVEREAARLAVASGARAVKHEHVIAAVKKIDPKAIERLVARRPVRQVPSTREHPAKMLDRVTVELREACDRNPRLLALIRKEAPNVVKELGLATEQSRERAVAS